MQTVTLQPSRLSSMSDSSRFWPVDSYVAGTSPPSFDKQLVRDYLETLEWKKTPPAPKLPQEVIEKSARNIWRPTKG